MQFTPTFSATDFARQQVVGMEPAEVVRRVLDVIQNNELYVFTHPETREAIEERSGRFLPHSTGQRLFQFRKTSGERFAARDGS